MIHSDTHAESAYDRTRLVFQYGSNCSDEQINGEDRLRGDARYITIAETVDEYEIAFDVFSKGRRCAAANIVRKPGSKVFGVLYEVPEYLIGRSTAKERGRKSLDAIEGEGTNYERRDIDVRARDGRILTALTYTVLNPRSGVKTSSEYVRCIIVGLRERGAPEDYINRVKQIAIANNADLASTAI